MANATPAPPSSGDSAADKLKIYFLPNLLTAGNLFCGFVALTKIVEADPAAANFTFTIRIALFYILLACIFDLFDGRVARMGGRESPFGREFDSLADVVSFGVAPAFLVHRIVLADVFRDYPKIGWFIASIYLICGAFRLARFNCLAARDNSGGGKEFLGFPIPAAAGFVASLTLLLLWAEDHDYTKFRESYVRYALPVMLVFLSMMMVSEVKYPTFKKLDFRATRTFPKMVAIVLFIGFFVILWERVLHFVLPAAFASYLIYGFVRPFISRRMRHEIEDEDEEDEEEAPPLARRMFELPSIVTAALAGFIVGVLLCIPVGPVNLTILNQGARRGFKWAALIGAGATAMELIYCGIAFTSFAAFFGRGWIKSVMEVFSFAFLMFLGFKFLFAKDAEATMHFGKVADKIEERIEEKLHPHSAFMMGFVQTLANPGVLVGWIVIGAILVARGYVEPTWTGKMACLGGVALGVGLWFVGISWAISLGHKKFTRGTLLKMQRGSGIVLIILATGHGCLIAWELSKLHRERERERTAPRTEYFGNPAARVARI